MSIYVKINLSEMIPTGHSIKPAIKYTNNIFAHVIPAKAGIQELQ